MNDFIHHIPTCIELCEGGDLRGLDVQKLGRYLAEKTGFPFRNQRNTYKRFSEERTEAVAKELARIEVKDRGGMSGQMILPKSKSISLPDKYQVQKLLLRNRKWESTQNS